jgi:DNA invertase Pin-like site-specific DNA recombinase
MNACGYVRLAAESRAGEVAQQQLHMEGLAAEQGLRVERWFVDDGVDGLTTFAARPAAAALLAELAAGAYQVVCVLSLDRLARSRALADAAVRAVADRGAAVRVLRQAVDLTAMGVE